MPVAVQLSDQREATALTLDTLMTLLETEGKMEPSEKGVLLGCTNPLTSAIAFRSFFHGFLLSKNIKGTLRDKEKKDLVITGFSGRNIAKEVFKAMFRNTAGWRLDRKSFG